MIIFSLCLLINQQKICFMKTFKNKYSLYLLNSFIKLFILICLSLAINTIKSIAQSVNYNNLYHLSIYTPGDLIANERVIILKGDVAVNGDISQSILTNQNFINHEESSWETFNSDILDLKAFFASIEGIIIGNSISNQTLEPDVYNITGDLNISGNIFLSGLPTDTFVFNISGDLYFDDFTNIISSNINPSQIYYNVGGKIVAGDNCSLNGIFFSVDQIDFSKYILGSVSLFSLNGDIMLSSLLNIISPFAHELSGISNDDGYSNCIIEDIVYESQGLIQSPGGNCVVSNNTLSFFDPNNWKVNANLNINSPLIEVGVNFHSLLDASGQNNFKDNNDTLVLMQLFDWAQALIRRPRAPSDPQTSVCGNCHIKDSRIQLVLKRIEFYNSDILNTTIQTNLMQNAMMARDSEMLKDLNVFWTQGKLKVGTSEASGFAVLPTIINGGVNEYFQYVVMLNKYQENLYDPNASSQGHYATAVGLAHEFGHNLDLVHTYYGGGASSPM